MQKYQRFIVPVLLSLLLVAGCDAIVGIPTAMYPYSPSRLVVVSRTAGATELTWHDNAANETFQEIERLGDDNVYLPLATLPANVVEFTDTTTEPGRVYCYRVRAANERGTSDWTNSHRVSPAFTDPAGDAYGVEAYQYDIVSVGFDPATSTVEIGFNGPVYPVDSPITPLVGVLEIDIDNSDQTGFEPTMEFFGPDEPPVEMGVEYCVDLWAATAEPDGSYTAQIVDLTGVEAPRIATVLYCAESVRITIPSVTIDFDDGECTVSIVVGTDLEPTDEIGPIRFY